MFKDFKLINYSVSKDGVVATIYRYGDIDYIMYFDNVKSMRKHFSKLYKREFILYYIRRYKEDKVLGYVSF